MNADSIVTIGSNATCDLRLEDSSVSGLHAQARLDSSGYLWLRDQDSAKGTHLGRNDGWVKVRLVCVCTGDQLRFGNVSVELDQITRLFGDDTPVRLAPTPESSLYDARAGRYTLRDRNDEPTLSNPKRNPTTGGLVDTATGESTGEGDEDDLKTGDTKA